MQDDSRQAGILKQNLIGGVGFDPAGFGCDALHHGVDPHNQFGEYFDEWFPVKSGRLVEAYLNGEIGLNVTYFGGFGNRVCKLLFFAVPQRGDRHITTSAAKELVDADAASLECERGEEPVNLLVSQVVETAKGFIPSILRFVGPEFIRDEEAQPLGDSLRPARAVASLVFAKREFGICGGGVSGNQSGGIVDSVVKRGAEAIDQVKCNSTHNWGRLPRYAKLVMGPVRFRIMLTDELSWPTAEIGEVPRFKFG